VKYLVVPESQHAKTFRFNPPVATFIIVAGLLVLSAIKFYHQLRFKAREIRDIAPDRDLAAETVSAKLAAAESLPQMLFGVSGLISQLPGPPL
jgi:hypothetical protein